MNNVLSTLLTPDPGALTPLHVVLAAVRKALPKSAAVRRDEAIGLLSDAGYKLSFVAGCLHVAGAKLAI